MSSTSCSSAPQRSASSPAARRNDPTDSGTAGTSARIVGGTGGMFVTRGLPDPAPRDASGCRCMVRALGCGVTVVLLCAPGSAQAAGCAHLPAGWRPHVADARGWAAQRHGAVSFAVRTEQRLYGWRTRRTVPMASVLKAMLLVAYLNRGTVRDRPLRAADHRLLDPMVRRSDNATATRVRAIVGDAGLYRLAHRVGMSRFETAPIWGLSRTDAADQTRFFLHLERYVTPRHRATALHLLRSIVPSQRWGIGRVALPGWRTYFKGGWGSGTGAVDHQVVLLRGCGETRVAAAVMTTGNGSHAYGQRTLEGVFRRLLRGVTGPRAARAASPARRPPRAGPARP